MASSKAFFAVVAGVGAGTGRSVALRFAKAYPVLLFARNPESYSDIVAEINKSGGQALGISTDVGDAQAVRSAFDKAKREWPDRKLAAAIYNTGGGFSIKGFQEQSIEDLDRSLSSNVRGLFNFAQQTIPQLLESVDDFTDGERGAGMSSSSRPSPTLIITGATASIRGSARFGTFAAGKFAVRGLGQSLAREFGPKGVHVAHVIIDGAIDTPQTKGWTPNEGKEDGKLSPDAISEAYWFLHAQHRSAFTQELDLRPWAEKF
jgi:NAD(P)-dependent dehydrogenase (short-subunit alcohol dehydrogenase family)